MGSGHGDLIWRKNNIKITDNNIELRTIKVDNTDSFRQVIDSDLFVLPANIDDWNPNGGGVVTIDNPQ